jgi:putative transposase
MGAPQNPGELARLGYAIALIQRCGRSCTPGIDPAQRRAGPTWRQLLTGQAHAIVACDFLVVETVLLKRLSALVLSTALDGSTWPE